MADVLGQVDEGLSKPSPLVTDRPDQTESSIAVRPGVIQVELGWLYTSETEVGTELKTHTVPQSLLRIGVIPGLEARVGFAGWMRSELVDRQDPASTTAATNGVGDLELGFKYQVPQPDGSRADLAILGGATVPTGQAGFGSERVDPNIRLSFSTALGPRVSLGSNIGASWTSSGTTSGTETLVDLLYTAVVGVALTNRFGAFAESFGGVALEASRPSTHAFDGGVTFLVSPNFQLDMSGGVGLSAAAADWFVGAGMAFRVGR